MKKLFAAWVIGIETVIIWASMVYCLLAFANGSFLTGVLYLAIAVIVLIFSLSGSIKRALANFQRLNLLVILCTKGLLALVFLVQLSAQLRLHSLLVQENAAANISLFASTSTFILIVFFLVYELYLLFQKQN